MCCPAERAGPKEEVREKTDAHSLFRTGMDDRLPPVLAFAHTLVGKCIVTCLLKLFECLVVVTRYAPSVLQRQACLSAHLSLRALHWAQKARAAARGDAHPSTSSLSSFQHLHSDGNTMPLSQDLPCSAHPALSPVMYLHLLVANPLTAFCCRSPAYLVMGVQWTCCVDVRPYSSHRPSLPIRVGQHVRDDRYVQPNASASPPHPSLWP